MWGPHPPWNNENLPGQAGFGKYPPMLISRLCVILSSFQVVSRRPVLPFISSRKACMDDRAGSLVSFRLVGNRNFKLYSKYTKSNVPFYHSIFTNTNYCDQKKKNRPPSARKKTPPLKTRRSKTKQQSTSSRKITFGKNEGRPFYTLHLTRPPPPPPSPIKKNTSDNTKTSRPHYVRFSPLVLRSAARR